jgi:hypothetical protein
MAPGVATHQMSPAELDMVKVSGDDGLRCGAQRRVCRRRGAGHVANHTDVRLDDRCMLKALVTRWTEQATGRTVHLLIM